MAAMKFPTQRLNFTVAILCLPVLVGCGARGPAGREVAGSVSFQGTPLATGTIEFFSPDDPAQTCLTQVANGKYFIPGAGGLLPGTYGVRIESVFVRAARGEATDVVPKVVDIPAKYNSDTELTAEVGEQAQQTIDFQLE